MGEQSEHSLLSASGASRWTRCYGSIALESTQPNEGSSYAREGTAAHALAAWLLGGSPKELTHWDQAQNCGLADNFIGCEIEAEGQTFTVDFDFAQNVQRYVDYVRSIVAPGDILLVETRVNYANWLGVPEPTAWGTSDAIVAHMNPVPVFIDQYGWPTTENADDVAFSGRLVASAVDLKFGAGVAVSAANNEQGLLYTGGSLNEIELVAEINDDDIIRIAIHQPRIGEGEPSEWYVQVGSLKRWLRGEAATAAAHALAIYNEVNFAHDGVDMTAVRELTPGDKQCRFCNAKAICPALAQHAFNTVAGEFVNLDEPKIAKTLSAKIDVKALDNAQLAEKMKAVDLIEAWIKDIRAAVERHLIEDPTSVPGYKLVRGKAGARQWADPEKALKKLKTYVGAKDAIKPVEPISPTTAEKLAKAAKITARQWSALQELITQAQGGLSVAPESDRRPAEDARPNAAAFTPVEDDGSDLV